MSWCCSQRTPQLIALSPSCSSCNFLPRSRIPFLLHQSWLIRQTKHLTPTITLSRMQTESDTSTKQDWSHWTLCLLELVTGTEGNYSREGIILERQLFQREVFERGHQFRKTIIGKGIIREWEYLYGFLPLLAVSVHTVSHSLTPLPSHTRTDHTPLLQSLHTLCTQSHTQTQLLGYCLSLHMRLRYLNHALSNTDTYVREELIFHQNTVFSSFGNSGQTCEMVPYILLTIIVQFIYHVTFLFGSYVLLSVVWFYVLTMSLPKYPSRPSEEFRRLKCKMILFVSSKFLLYLSYQQDTPCMLG